MKKRNFEFPTAFTVLFLILIVVTILTRVIPTGTYSRIQYDEVNKNFIVKSYGEEDKIFEASQENLDKMGMKVDLKKFTEGTIKKPMALVGTYRRIKQHPKGFIDFIKAPIQGVTESIDIIIFILILGGIVGLINKTGTFNTAMKKISTKTKGKEFFLIVIALTFFAIGGTTFGFWEETIPFYSILVPLFLVNGFDVITCMATLFVGAALGCMFSTVNPFSTIIASNAAGITFNEGLNFRLVALVLGILICIIYIYFYARKVKKDPSKSIIYDINEGIKEKFLKNYSEEKEVEFNIRQKIILFLFVFQFFVMVWGVSKAGWWFQEAAAMFFAVAVVIMFLSGLKEKEAVSSFISGASEVVGVTLIIGLARAINIIMEGGMISDTLLYFSSNLVDGMDRGFFAIIMFLIFAFLGIFIPSTSGLAVLSMPILAPLADAVGLSRSVVVDAFAWGQGIILFLTPTGLIFVVLQIVEVPYNKWLKFILPLTGIIAIFSIAMLYLKTFFNV